MSATLVDRLRELMDFGSGKTQPPFSKEHSQKHSEEIAEWTQNATQETIDSVFASLFDASVSEWQSNVPTIASVLVGFIRRQVDGDAKLPDEMATSIGKLYPQIDSHPAIQCLLLRVCVATKQGPMLGVFAELLTSSSSLSSRGYIEVFGDLLRSGESSVDAVFPKILEGLARPSLAGFVLDYANYAYRNGFVHTHPAEDRTAEMSSLLSSLSDRLQQLQDTRPESEEDAVLRGKQVTESIALGVALCDALGSIGDQQAVASLNKAFDVDHRRLRVESAAALVRLGVDDAKSLLTAMAAEPIERLRVLAYAEELDILDDVEEEFSNIVARAEAQFVMYLAQPDQMGIAPQHIEMIDQCELAWPGYEEPRNCYLFQYVYQFPGGEYSNIGIAGPVVMKFDADLTFLPREDIYALFAGWHVQHDDIFAVESHQTAGQDQIQMQRMMRSLTESDEYEDVTPAIFGTLLDRRVLIAAARRKEESGWAMVGEDSVSWLPIGHPERPLGSGEAFYLFVGRSLLKSFN